MTSVQNGSHHPSIIKLCKPRINYAAVIVSASDHLAWMKSTVEAMEQAASMASVMTWGGARLSTGIALIFVRMACRKTCHAEK